MITVPWAMHGFTSAQNHNDLEMLISLYSDDGVAGLKVLLDFRIFKFA